MSSSELNQTGDKGQRQDNADGVRMVRACAEADICLRTYRRWVQNGAVQHDKRPMVVKPAPANKLSPQEQTDIVKICNSTDYSQLPPSQIVGYEVHEAESGEYAAQPLQRCLLRGQCLHQPLVLKYRPQWPSSGFASIHEARQWVERFVSGYNTEHRHRKLNFVTPQQRHNGKDTVPLAQRQAILEQAQLRNPSRWGTHPLKNCKPIGPVSLNPKKEMKIQQAA